MMETLIAAGRHLGCDGCSHRCTEEEVLCDLLNALVRMDPEAHRFWTEGSMLDEPRNRLTIRKSERQ